MLGYVALVGEQRDILCGVRARFNDPDISVHLRSLPSSGTSLWGRRYFPNPRTEYSPQYSGAPYLLGYVALVGEQRDILCGVRARFNDPDISVHRLESTHAATYEACRLAALVFGVGVIFPIPAQNTPLNTCWVMLRWSVSKGTSFVEFGLALMIPI
jgi:hypothetical protein